MYSQGPLVFLLSSIWEPVLNLVCILRHFLKNREGKKQPKPKTTEQKTQNPSNCYQVRAGTERFLPLVTLLLK